MSQKLFKQVYKARELEAWSAAFGYFRFGFFTSLLRRPDRVVWTETNCIIGFHDFLCVNETVDVILLLKMEIEKKIDRVVWIQDGFVINKFFYRLAIENEKLKTAH